MTEQQIFEQALEMSPDDRAAFLDFACAGDAMLRRRLEALLKSHSEAQGFLNVPAVEQLAVSSSEPADAAADLSFLAPSSEPGSLGRLDHYDVLEVVGSGGMGMVLRARDTKLLRVVALKVLAAPLAASGTARQRFVREARAAAAVRNDHIVAIHAVCDDGPVPYLVMEFIDGCTLELLIRRGGPLEVKEILRIGVQIASGLAAAHKQGLIHRDVKPANILLENGVQRVKLTDFGLARAADDASLTQSGLIAGTPLYMAPEQAAGEAIDARSDLFSLGSVLYEMCTGRPAFRAANTVAVIRRVCDDTPRPIREVNPDIPEALCQVIEHLHAKKPADRPASANEIADSLTRLLADLQQPVAGGHVSNVPANRARWKRAPRRVLYAAAALVMLAVGLGMSEATGVTDVSGTVIRLFSPEGTLVVEVDDPNVSVTVEGGDVVITGAGAKEIRLKPGQYKVEASKDGKLLRQELVTVTRNGRQVVRISKEGESLADAEAWERAVAALPAEQQVKAVVRRLKELNPAFDGAVTPTIEGGVAKGLSFLTDDVTNISPVRALRGLEVLECHGTFLMNGKLTDLTPLRGLQLKRLKCNSNPVSNLEPLQGMPLSHLVCAETRVHDLSPLKGMQLEVLALQRTQVSDLSPLRGMPLIHLDLFCAQGITDLKPLKGAPLRYLNLTALRRVDLHLLTEMKTLETLILDSLSITDLTPLRGLRLKFLSIQGTPVMDLTPIQEMPLHTLRLDYQAGHKEVLRSLTNLAVINGKSASEFWKDVDGQ
jgi:serine/threonine protein kinase